MFLVVAARPGFGPALSPPPPPAPPFPPSPLIAAVPSAQGEFSYDAFFAEHDLNADRVLDKDEVRRLYDAMASSLGLPQGMDAAPIISAVSESRGEERGRKERNVERERR